jgi:hypothetical protein
LAELYGSDCITLRQKQFIESTDHNARLLDILRRCSETDFHKFIKGMERTKQEQVTQILLEEGTVAQVVATTGSCEQDEKYIVEQFKNLLSSSPASKRDTLLDEVRQHVHELKSCGVHLFAAKKQNSIGLYYFCRSLDGLQHLYDLFSSGKLKEIVERVFTVLLNNSRPTPVVVECLRWDIRDYAETNNKASRGKHSETIQSLHIDLMMFVDTQYGLLDELRELGVITRQQADEIGSELSCHSRSRSSEHLLNLIVEMSEEKQEQFLSALDNNQQSHISEYIRANGDLSNLNRERWPLPKCNEFKTIEKNWRELRELIDLKLGLMDELLAVGFLNERQMKSIDENEKEADKTEELLNLIYSISFGNFEKFLKCLKKTKQVSVIPLLSTSFTYDEQPLNDLMKSHLEERHAHLVELLDVRNGLLAELSEAECITLRQKQFIESAELATDGNARLLTILRNGSEEGFNKFVDWLSKRGHKHLSSLVLEDGVVISIDVVTSCSISEEIRIVERIIEVITASLGNCSNAEHVKAGQYAEIVECLNELNSHNIQLITAKTKNNIGLYYLCRSLDGLQHLYDLFSSGKLKEIVERIFTVLLNSGKPVVLECLRWDFRDYINCLRSSYSSAGLKVFCELYGLPINMHLKWVDCTVSSLHFDKLLHELLELLLIKTMGQFLVVTQKVTPRAAVYTMATLCGVSKLWWGTITYIKRVIKRYFRHFCSPFESEIQKFQSQYVEDNVLCLTEFNGQLLVGVAGNASVQVFNSGPPFSRLDDIKVQDLNEPSDIVMCKDTCQLYIADRGNQSAVWRVDFSDNKHVDKFITLQWQPYSLSVNSRRLLITPFDGDALFIFTNDGSQLNRIKLPEYMYATHAVETKHNTYIVSHGSNQFEDAQSEHNSVSEVNVDGRVVRTFTSQNTEIDSIQFNVPQYLTLDDNDHVIVADFLNERVVVLKSDLKLKRVLLSSSNEKPLRLCLSKSTGLLFISFLYSNNISVYRVGS